MYAEKLAFVEVDVNNVGGGIECFWVDGGYRGLDLIGIGLAADEV